MIFTDNAEKQYQDFEEKDLTRTDENLGIKYERDAIVEDTVLLLRYNCPDKDCDVACFGWPDLHRHVKTKHGKVMCDLCTRNKKVFTHEHELFTFGELRKHEKFGDDNPGAIDQSGFKGHPECGFCRLRFYGDDELYTHCREKHERCHICDRRNGGRNPQYYRNYQELEKHFADVHFVCLDAECQANKTNVFESEMDLKAHQLSEHPNGMSKDVRRDARVVNLSGFDVRTPYQPSRRTGGGRGRDPNAEPLPMSSAQPLSRAELAYQRQMAIQNAAPTPQPAPSPRAQHARPTQQAPPSEPPSLDTLSLSSNTTPQDRARTLRHQALIDRASRLLSNSTPKLNQFRSRISSYGTSTISATDLIDSFFALFDCPSSDLGILARELADLYEDDAKRQNLLEAWNSWRSINEDYPSLPLPAGLGETTNSSGSMGANVSSGRRVLKLKSSTQQSSRSQTARQGSWGNISTPLSLQSSASGSGRGEAFPSLPPSSKKARGTPMSWAAPASTSSGANNANATAGRKTNANPRVAPKNTSDLFPSLPPGQKVNTSMANFNTRPLGRSGTSTPSSTQRPAWGPGSAGSAPTPAQAAAALEAANFGDDDERINGGNGIGGGNGSGNGSGGGSVGKKKGKKGRGEVLFHFG